MNKAMVLRQQTRERTIGKRHIAQICAELRRYVWVFTGKIGNLQYIYKNMTRNNTNFEAINNHVVIMDTAKLRSLESLATRLKQPALSVKSTGDDLQLRWAPIGPVIPGRWPRDWCRSLAKIIKDQRFYDILLGIDQNYGTRKLPLRRACANLSRPSRIGTWDYDQVFVYL